MKKICFSLLVLGMVSCSSDYVTNDFTPGTPVDAEAPETPVETESPEIPSEPGEEPTPQLNCLPASLQANLIASYNFANGSILDGSGNNNNLSYTNGTVPSVSDRAGNQNCAIQFNGTNHLQLIDFSQLENQSKLSISLWFINDIGVYPTNNKAYFIQAIHDTSLPTNTLAYNSFYLGTFDCYQVFSNNGTHSLWETIPTAPYMNCNNYVQDRITNWSHVVLNFDTTNNLYELYVNGLIATQTTTFTSNFSDFMEFYIGKNMYGTLDDIFIFNDVLSASQVTELMNLQPCCN